MVQRKVTNKLGIQADEVKTNELLLVNGKASSFQHHDAKSKGADLKKKMKKSRPTKRSDIERLSSASMRRQVPQPGKPPPPIVPKPVVATPEKKSPVRSSESTPNYMKSTSSSDARKERPPQVSSRNLQTLFDSKISSSQKSSAKKISSSSVPKAARTLARTSSLKLVRTLTKTTSFKPARASVKRCSPQVLSENLNAQRATCSSTLKDSKFPAYLELSSGGTESQGTSATKVCPYTYCSLNGHHHSPLPPLRCFLSARRRMLKAQRVVTLGCTSPRRSNPAGRMVKDDQVEEMKVDESFPNLEELSSSRNSPVIGQKPVDFFVQIFSKGRQGTEGITEMINHVSPLVEEIPGGDVKAEPLDYQQVPEMLSEESALFDVDSNVNGSENIDAISTIMEDAEYREEANQTAEGEEGHSLFPTQQKSSPESLRWWQDEIEGREIIPIDNTEFELSDMDWEADNYSVSLRSTEDLDLNINFFEGIQTGGLLQLSLDEEAFDEESVSSKDTCQNFKIQEYTEGPDGNGTDQLRGSTIEGGDGYVEECAKTIISTTSMPPEKLTQEPCPAERNIGKMCPQDDDAADEIWDPESQDFHDMSERSSKGWKDPTDSKDMHLDVTVEDEEKVEADTGNAFKADIRIPQEDAYEAKDESRGLEDNHLDAFNFDGRSDETLAGEESRAVSINTYGSRRVIDISASNPRDQELAEACVKLKWRPGSKRLSEEYYAEPKEFNPRGPNFLPVEPDPEAEKVDLKHQMMDERKNADEWMLDHAIQLAVTKLGQARKKKVSLLVEAFEAVMPIPKFKAQQRHSSVAFPHARTMQACS